MAFFQKVHVKKKSPKLFQKSCLKYRNLSSGVFLTDSAAIGFSFDSKFFGILNPLALREYLSLILEIVSSFIMTSSIDLSKISSKIIASFFSTGIPISLSGTGSPLERMLIRFGSGNSSILLGSRLTSSTSPSSILGSNKVIY